MYQRLLTVVPLHLTQFAPCLNTQAVIHTYTFIDAVTADMQLGEQFD